MFKTKGFWKACQQSAGIIEWTSPGGRTYRTEPHLTYNSETYSETYNPEPPGEFKPPIPNPEANPVATGAADPDDYSGDPPPF